MEQKEDPKSLGGSQKQESSSSRNWAELNEQAEKRLEIMEQAQRSMAIYGVPVDFEGDQRDETIKQYIDNIFYYHELLKPFEQDLIYIKEQLHYLNTEISRITAKRIPLDNMIQKFRHALEFWKTQASRMLLRKHIQTYYRSEDSED